MTQKNILLLQDATGGFFRSLYNELLKTSLSVFHINICPAEYFYWFGKQSTNYRGTFNKWPIFLEEYVIKNKITHIIYNQDRFHYHIEAIKIANKHNIAAYVCENGYLRPNWITFERNGMSALSYFPDNPLEIINNAHTIPKNLYHRDYPYSFSLIAFNEVLFHLLNTFLFFLYPNFSQKKYYHPIREYISFIPKLIFANKKNKLANNQINQLISHHTPYFLFPLQLQSDYQIHYNSPFKHITEAIEITIRSFANYAQKNSVLVLKIHPHDSGVEPWEKILKLLASKYNVSKRVLLLDGGNLELMYSHTKGIITINSTATIFGLKQNCKAIVLGIATYDIPELTFQGHLDVFWESDFKPDKQVYKCFEKLMANTIQIKGNFYTKDGKKAVAKTIVKKILTDDKLYINTHPPRISKALKMGIDINKTHLPFTNLWLSKWKKYLQFK